MIFLFFAPYFDDEPDEPVEPMSVGSNPSRTHDQQKTPPQGRGFLLVSPTGLGTPAGKLIFFNLYIPAAAGPPRVVRLKHRISPSDLLGSMLVFANFPLRTYGFFPSQTYQQKTPPQGRGFLLVMLTSLFTSYFIFTF